MKVTYQENPLHNLIELSDKEWSEFERRLEVYIQQEIEGAPDGAFNKDWQERAKAIYREELTLGYHIGDCTAFPASCCKCHMEDLLGYRSCPAGKSPGHVIHIAFEKNETTTCRDAIGWLLDKAGDEKNSSYRSSYRIAAEFLERHLPRIGTTEDIPIGEWKGEFEE